MQHAFKLLDQEHNLALSRSPDAHRLHVESRTLAVSLHTSPDGTALLTVGAQQHRVVLAQRGDEVFIHLGGEAYALRYEHPLTRLAANASGSAEDKLVAPMPGAIVSVLAAAGEAVAKGQALLVMESMKMETTLAAPRDGVVAEVRYAKGQTFERDAVLLSLEPQT